MNRNTEGEVVIRKAKKEDMVHVLHLIKELAKFEKAEGEVKITADVLVQDGFGSDNPSFSCLVAELLDGPIIGYAIFYPCYSTWTGKSTFLEDIYVQPIHRKKGIGRKLFINVASIALKTSKRLDFHVLSWNSATEFYIKLGAKNLTSTETWQLFRLNESSLRKLFS